MQVGGTVVLRNLTWVAGLSRLISVWQHHSHIIDCICGCRPLIARTGPSRFNPARLERAHTVRWNR